MVDLRCGVRSMDMTCKSPALFPASCPAPERDRKAYEFRRPVLLPFLPALHPPLLRQVLMLDPNVPHRTRSSRSARALTVRH